MVMGNDATDVDSLNDHMARVLEPRTVGARIHWPYRTTTSGVEAAS